MAGKYGSNSFTTFLIDGYDLLGSKPKNATIRITSMLERTDGLGDSWEASSPTGMKKGELTQEGAFFDDSARNIHEALVNSTGTTRILCAGQAGSVAGRAAIGFQGVYGMSYDVLGQVGKLTRANVVYQVSGQVDHGVILQPLADQASDFIGATVDDRGAGSTAGGVGYLQSKSVFGSFVGKIEHSDDAVSWTDLIVFTTVTASPTAERLEVSGAVKRYLRFQGDVFDNDAAASVSSSTSVSPSTSRSPSVSASSSGSTSVSPSASISPSVSVSYTPSGSISPSKSASASVSPSSSISPSVSASSSVSPSAGLTGTATVFSMFRRY